MRNVEWHHQVREEIVDPEREICDPHHHLWDHPGSRYLLDEVLADVDDGPPTEPASSPRHHRVTGTVFVECAAMYRADGPVELAPVGETEFVQGIAAMSASGGYGSCRVAAGIVGFADLTLGAGVRAVLDATSPSPPSASRASGTPPAGTAVPTSATRTPSPTST